MVEIRHEIYNEDGTVTVETLEITITWEEIFNERETMMKNTDSFVLPDRGLTESQLSDIQTYRQAWRDITDYDTADEAYLNLPVLPNWILENALIG
ncbi:MAG: hypothetical protein GOVbin1753_64 [Prokaryotic dsDNA virus sp.]|nr:MAG: hypothetical protein GOVbin1753_64 [Prokaryotic dsDNA virus sp.]|tara:strand:+ start:5064 stop:5351 length:288 start_codon:yes stop_codon:yes gene_type:complete